VILFSSRPQEIPPGPGVTGFLAVAGADSASSLEGGVYRILDDQNHTGGLPAPSPDGQTIAYGKGSTGWLYRWETGPEVFDPADYGVPGYRDVCIGSPAWSPDGTRLAWIVSGAFAADKSFQMGVGVFDLETRTTQVLHVHESELGDGWPAAPVWSPDGKWLAFTAWAQDPDEAGVWVVRADGRQEEGYEYLFTEYHLGGDHPVWSPDGGWLAFNRVLQDGGRSSWVAQVGTWGLVRLALPPGAYVVDWVSSE
jgi:Tol biopolymer transport system component